MSSKKTPSHNSEGRKLYNKQDDESLRKDKDTGLWIKHRKTVYLYWYKFLQDCLREGYKVDKSKYRGWDINTIVETPFDIWWVSHKEKLFSTKERTGTPKVTLTTTQPRKETIRMSWFVYLYDKKYKKGKHSNLDIAYKIVKRESTKRYLSNTNAYWFRQDKDTGKMITPGKLRKWDRGVMTVMNEQLYKSKYSKTAETEFEYSKKYEEDKTREHERNLKERTKISKRISDLRSNADKIIENVCKGQFP